MHRQEGFKLLRENTLLMHGKLWHLESYRAKTTDPLNFEKNATLSQ
jgi:hypothetical protein